MSALIRPQELKHLEHRFLRPLVAPWYPCCLYIARYELDAVADLTGFPMTPSRFLRAYGLGFLSYLSPRLFSLLLSKARRKHSNRNRDVLPAVSKYGSLLILFPHTIKLGSSSDHGLIPHSNRDFFAITIDSRNLQEVFRVSQVPCVLRCHDWWLAHFTAIV